MSNTFYFCNMFSWGSLTLFCGALFVSVVSTEKLHPSTNPTNRKAKRRSLTKGKRRMIRRCARGFGRGPGGTWICLYKVAFLMDGAMGKITIFHPPFGRICQRNLFLPHRPRELSQNLDLPLPVTAAKEGWPHPRHNRQKREHHQVTG